MPTSRTRTTSTTAWSWSSPTAISPDGAQPSWKPVVPCSQAATGTGVASSTTGYDSSAVAYHRLALLHDKRGDVAKAESLYREALALRREVLGDAHVDRALQSATDFTRPMQDLVTENCWGEVWTRDAIPKKTRSLVTIAILAALRAPAEIKLHVRGALRNGCSVEEIQDVLLQATVYCGVPAGVDAFRAAKEVIDDWTTKSRHNGP